MQDNYFKKLYSINVNEYVETKNGLKYCSWSFVWAEIKKIYPDANYTVYENKDGLIYHTDGNTCWVKTGVIVNGIEHIEYLPVMDYKNKSIPVSNVTSFDVNKAIQRSLTKACARHGLGLYIYAGEDLPEQPKEELSQEIISSIQSLDSLDALKDFYTANKDNISTSLKKEFNSLVSNKKAELENGKNI